MKRLAWLLLLSVVTIRPASVQETASKMLEVTLRSRSFSCKINDNLELEIIRENVGSHDRASLVGMGRRSDKHLGV